jgi:hypothetical protein
MMVLEQVGRLHGCVLDGVVLTHQGERRLVMEVGTGAVDVLLRPSEQCDRLAAPMAARCAARYPALGTSQRHLGHPQDARRGDLMAVRQGGEGLQPQLNAGSMPDQCRWSHPCAGAGARAPPHKTGRRTSRPPLG